MVVAVRSPRGRALLAAIAGSFALTLLASYLRYWPYGFGRTNLFEVPLLVLLAGIGICGSAQHLLALRVRHGRHFPAGQPMKVTCFATTMLLVVGLFGILLAAGYEVASYGQMHSTQPQPRYGDEVSAAVASVRQQADSGAAVVVVGAIAIPGWRYYQSEYTGRSTQTGPQIPQRHILYVARHGSPAITRFVTTVHPSELFIYVPNGTTGRQLDLDIDAASVGGTCHQIALKTFPTSGLLGKNWESCSLPRISRTIARETSSPAYRCA